MIIAAHIRTVSSPLLAPVQYKLAPRPTDRSRTAAVARCAGRRVRAVRQRGTPLVAPGMFPDRRAAGRGSPSAPRPRQTSVLLYQTPERRTDGSGVVLATKQGCYTSKPLRSSICSSLTKHSFHGGASTLRDLCRPSNRSTRDQPDQPTPPPAALENWQF